MSNKYNHHVKQAFLSIKKNTVTLYWYIQPLDIRKNRLENNNKIRFLFLNNIIFWQQYQKVNNTTYAPFFIIASVEAAAVEMSFYWKPLFVHLLLSISTKIALDPLVL